MKVLFAGGGTAGHINPALAIAGYIREKEPNAKLLYIGNKGGMEERLVPAAGFAFKTITISGFQRKLTPKHIVENMKTVGRIFTSSNEAKHLIQEFSEKNRIFVLWDRWICKWSGNTCCHKTRGTFSNT